MQPSSPFATALQPIPVPVAPPPTIPDDPHDWLPEQEPQFDARAERRARWRRLLARTLGVLGILLTAAFAFMTVGRAWLGSLRSVWPSLQLQPEPTLPAPLAPDREPGLLPAPVERLIPPLEALPGTPSGTVESAPPEPAAAEPAAPTAPVPPEPADRPRMSSPPLSGDGQSSVPLLTEPALPGDPAPSEVMTPADLPAPPSTHPAAPEAPPAGEATPAMPPGESDSVFPEE